MINIQPIKSGSTTKPKLFNTLYGGITYDKSFCVQSTTYLLPLSIMSTSTPLNWEISENSISGLPLLCVLIKMGLHFMPAFRKRFKNNRFISALDPDLVFQHPATLSSQKNTCSPFHSTFFLTS